MKRQKRHRHKYGPLRWPSDDIPHQVCKVCGAVRFLGDRYAYGTR